MPAVKAGICMFSDQCDKPNSVIGRPSIWAGSRLLARAALLFRGTALHRGKNFAVSFQDHSWLTLIKSPSSFEYGRFCSHLAPHGVQALPATLLQLALPVFGLSSPRNLGAIVCTGPVELYHAYSGRESFVPTDQPLRTDSPAATSST